MRLTAWGFWIPVAPLVGARGLKLHDDGRRAKRAHVAPLVGARGLKHYEPWPMPSTGSRAPRGGAWIETSLQGIWQQSLWSRPSWGRVD